MTTGLEQDLRDLIALRRILVVVGSGVSIAATRNAPAASWGGLLKVGGTRCRELKPALDEAWGRRLLEEISSGDLDDTLSAAEKVCRKLDAPNGPEFRRWLRETVGALELVDPTVIEALRDLQVPLATTNYDGLLERVTGLPPVTWRDQSKVFRVLRGEEQAVLHLHGYWEEPESVVLGVRSYEQVRQDAHAQAVVRALAMVHSFLFVGCGEGLSDPNFRPFLTWLCEVNSDNDARHYRLAREQEVVGLQNQHHPNERVYVLPYGSEHANLPGFLRRLAPPVKMSGAIAPEPTPIPGPPQPAKAAARVVPRGLRCFEAEDHDWFLRLVPGPRNGQGLPESLRFWKTRLEQGDPDRTFKVGLIYGPSGCGKSSLIKAGLIPALSEFVLPIYVAATADRTETEILRALRKALPDLPEDRTLCQTVDWLIERPAVTSGRKVVLILDQFEQWLHAHQTEIEPDLVGALRTCDGSRWQALLMARDDFQTAVHRLFQALEVPLQDGQNFALVDLFDLDHARAVLIEYGRAYGRLPDPAEPLEPEQARFLDGVINELKTPEDKVVCIHLVLLAEMLKGREWSMATLDTLGGGKGVGKAFLEEKLGRRCANPDHRAHRLAATAVLKRLLPEPGADIRGRSRSASELQSAAGYADRPADYQRMIRILDDELKLVTPTEGEGASSSPGEARYQLTHDYLVPALRDWLPEVQREKARGRAMLCLEERTAQWTVTQSFRFLPGPTEFLRILLLVPRKNCRPEQTAMLRSARWTYTGLLAGFCIALLIAIGLWNRAETRRATTLVQSLEVAPAHAFPYALTNLLPLQNRALSVLRDRFNDPSATPQNQLHLAMAMAALGDLKLTFLLDQVAVGWPDQCMNLVHSLARSYPPPLPEIMDRFTEARTPEERVRFATVALFLGDLTPLRQLTALTTNPVNRTAFIHGYPRWPGDPIYVAAILREGGATADPGDLRSAVCASLGLMPWDAFTVPQQEALRKTMEQLYTEAPDGGTHSAAAYALNRWGQPLPKAGSGVSSLTPSRNPPSDRGWFVNGQGMTMVRIPAGTFTMGDSSEPDAPPHAVTLTRDFYMADREVTVALFRRFAEEAAKPDYAPAEERVTDWPGEDVRVSATADSPVQNVSWLDAVRFCNWLSRRENRTPCYRLVDSFAGSESWEVDPGEDGYRLPTEVEWEHACRAGSNTPFAFGDDQDGRLLQEYSYFVGNSSRAWPSGSKLPNGLGMFDMHGNLAEWCWDWFDPQRPDTASAPSKPNGAVPRAIRTGSWRALGEGCTSSSRLGISPTDRDNRIGFRVVLGTSSFAR